MDIDLTINKPILVIGGGSFGTTIANLLAENGNFVYQWMRDPKQAENIRTKRENTRYLKGIKVNKLITPVTELENNIPACEVIFVVLPSHALRTVLQPYKFILKNKCIISLTKGIEIYSFKLMSQIIKELVPTANIGVMSGPNLAREIAEKKLTATVIASENKELFIKVKNILNGNTFRVYYSSDSVGVELSGALKNIYAIIAGLCFALNIGDNTRSIFLVRALAEMTKFSTKFGANPITFIGLSGVGDLILTCFSSKSRNYQIGYLLGKGCSLEQAILSIGETAEGINTIKAVKKQADKLNIYMPLVSAIHAIMFNKYNINTVIDSLIKQN